jgi:hypothetical protein
MAKKASKKKASSVGRKRKKVAKKSGPKKGTTYFSTQSLERAVKKGTKSVRKNAVKSAGYTVVQRGNWVVREFADGTYERISIIQTSQRSGRLALD